MKPKYDFNQYPLSDGDTYAQAIKNGREAFDAWVESVMADGKPSPAPNSSSHATNVEVRLPKSLHTRLRNRASNEGVNVPTLVQAYVAEALGRREVATKRR
jgi:antitoxin HicB